MPFSVTTGVYNIVTILLSPVADITAAINTLITSKFVGNVPQQAYKTNANASGAVTLTAAQCSGGSVEVWVNCTGTQAGGFTITLPTVALLVTAMQGANINPLAGGSIILNVMATNGAAQTGTVTTNTGWTLTGTLTVADATYRKLLVTFTSLSAFAAQSLGEYAITAGI
jgi:hypothetical protein